MHAFSFPLAASGLSAFPNHAMGGREAVLLGVGGAGGGGGFLQLLFGCGGKAR